MSSSKRKPVIAGHTSEEAYARELGLAVETLQKMRRRGETSAYVMIGRRAHYLDADKAPWLERNRVTPVRSGKKSSQVQSRSTAP
jgi:hypothetical protein